MSISRNEMFKITYNTASKMGLVGAVTKYATKSAISIYNRFVPVEYSIGKVKAKKISNLFAGLAGIAAGVGYFANAVITKKYGQSDAMPDELIQEIKDRKFAEKIARLFPHLMPNRFNQ